MAFALALAAVATVPRWEMTAPPTEGRQILFALDRSASMNADDVGESGQTAERTTRLAAARKAALTLLFSENPTGSLATADDAVGLMTFAGQARIEAIPQRDRTTAAGLLRQVQPARTLREDGTAIGDAIVLATNTLTTSPPATASPTRGDAEPSRQTLRPGLLILLTDGQQNAGRFDLEQAEQQAVESGLPIFIIAFRPNPSAAESAVWAKSDERLRQLADASGGRLFTAVDRDTIAAVFETIATLAPQPLPNEPPQHTDWAVHRWTAAGRRWPPLVPSAAVLLAVALLLRAGGAEVRP